MDSLGVIDVDLISFPEATFTDKTELIETLEIDNELAQFAELVPALKCLLCSFLTTDEPSLLNHYKLKHHVNTSVNENNNYKNYQSSDRSMLIKKGDKIDNSLEFESDNNKNTEDHAKVDQCVKVFFVCGNCNKELDSQEAVKEHMLKEHNAQVNTETECSEKNEIAATKPIKVIKNRLKKKQSMKASMKEKEKVECDVCNKMFAGKKCVRRHMRAVHSKIKPFVCQVCGHTTTHKNHLILHTRQHTGERPFACDLCDYRASDHNTLRRHVMRHLGVKPYKSPVCDYASVQRHTLTKHLQLFHPDIATPDTKSRKTPCNPEPKQDQRVRYERNQSIDIDHKTNSRQCMRDIFLHEETSEEPLDHGGVTIPAT